MLPQGKWIFLIAVVFFLTGCQGQEHIDVASLPDGTYVSCDNVRDKICSFEKDRVCAKIQLLDQQEDNIVWEDYLNPCNACHASTNKKTVLGFEKGKCGLSDADLATQKSKTGDSLVEDSKEDMCVFNPPEDLVNECNKRNGAVEPLDDDCNTYHCVVTY